MAVTFNGTTNYLTGTLSSVPTASDSGVLICWFNTDVLGGTLLEVKATGTGTATFIVTINSDGSITVNGRNSSGTLVLVGQTAVNVVTVDKWYCLLIAFDLSAQELQMFLNAIDVSPSSPTLTSGQTIDWTDTVWNIGASTSAIEVASNLYDGDMMEIVFWPGSFLDMTVGNSYNDINRDLFYVWQWKPVTPVGYNSANTALGASPFLWYTDRWDGNAGTGPDLTLQGSALAITTGPDCDRPSAQALIGEQWGKCDLCGWIFPKSKLVIQPSTGRTVCITGPHDLDKETQKHSNSPERTAFFI